MALVIRCDRQVMQQQPYPLGRFHAELQQLEPRFAAALDACTLFLRRYLPGE